MPLVNYEGDSSEEEDNNIQVTTDSKSSTTRRLHLPAPSHSSSNIVVDDDDDDEYPTETNIQSSSTLLANLPKPHDSSSLNTNLDSTEFIENELEDIVRGDNKEYAKNIPQLPKSIKRKRDGPVKIFIPSIEQDSDEEDKPKRKPAATKRNCALLNALPPPMHDEDKPTPSLPVVKNSSTAAPQISSTGLFIPYTINKKQQHQKKSSTTISNQSSEQTKNDSDVEDDDDDNQTDFLGLTKSNQIEITNTDVESVLRETFPKARPTVIEEPSLPNPSVDFEDLDHNEEINNQQINDDELLHYLPKSEHYKEIKHIHIDSMMGESARLQLLKNTTDERETMLAQAAIHVPKGETRKRAQITYLIAKAQHDDLQLKNMWSQQKLTKRQTQAKYGF
ncbi:unnamed protein product [Rotaria sp. Silwood1]|nr:unnamed protein product [Rotaria sp. Silwood1]CAF3361562.1 unnamed protein product [Rotaria sp. Silwood1]CAF3395758.1 unnamed protein product [Rotaria sp. Silwood1]CAF4568477.1 unnamed protein product [Rotaria sp. Silwood1]